MKLAHLRTTLGAAVLSVPLLAACESTPLHPWASGAAGDTATGGTSTGSDGLGGWNVGTGGSPVVLIPRVEPPPISGGTLLVLADGHTVAAADSDQDMVWFVDLDTQTVIDGIALEARDEPGRLVQDAAGRVHVVARRGGALITIDPTTHAVMRRPVCPAPRGLAYDAAADALHVACADGLLATFPAAGGAATASVRLDRDLRDVVLQGGVRYVSLFRSAEILAVASDGSITQRITLPTAPTIDGQGNSANMVPSVAYRMVAMPGGGLAMLHQRALDAVVQPSQGGYGGGMCPGTGIVQDTVTFVTPGTAPLVSAGLGMMTLAVDVAVSSDGTQVAVAAPGSALNAFGVSVIPVAQFQGVPGGCILSAPSDIPPLPGGGGLAQGLLTSPPQTIAVAFDGQGRLVTQTRAPAAITVGSGAIVLPMPGVTSVGHDIFYTGTAGGIACASCHPEAGDDGRVWQFAGFGARRTQNIRGGVLSRAPFHWAGDIPDMDALVTQVLVQRMSGPTLTEGQVIALGHWMDAQPALLPPPPANVAAMEHGRTIFEDPNVGCTACHSGSQVSNHALVDVGTGGTFKVPSLIAVGYRAPYLHDGCAATLSDRFLPSCGGGDMHGQTSQLSAQEISDLVSFLESL